MNTTAEDVRRRNRDIDEDIRQAREEVARAEKRVPVTERARAAAQNAVLRAKERLKTLIDKRRGHESIGAKP
jgi:hypothetical protein